MTSFKTALHDTVPVIAGYIFLGFGFGLLMYQSGFGILPALAMSVFVYAGSMQYAAVSLLSSDAGLLTAALTTLLVNARHIFYGIAMIEPYRSVGKAKPYLIFSLTDETFSLVSKDELPEGVDRRKYSIFVSVLDHAYWISGTLLGSIAGLVLPIDLAGIEFALTALFVTIFVDQWMKSKNHLPAATGILATLLCLIAFGKEYFLIPSMLIISVCLIFMTRDGGDEDD